MSKELESTKVDPANEVVSDLKAGMEPAFDWKALDGRPSKSTFYVFRATSHMPAHLSAVASSMARTVIANEVGQHSQFVFAPGRSAQLTKRGSAASAEMASIGSLRECRRRYR